MKHWQERAIRVKQIVDAEYQPHSHFCSMYDLYRRRVVREIPISIATFRRYMRFAVNRDGFIGTGSNRIDKPVIPELASDYDERQLKLFDISNY